MHRSLGPPAAPIFVGLLALAGLVPGPVSAAEPSSAPPGGVKADLSKVPGVVITHSAAKTRIYIGSPGIAILADGAYVAKCDEFGPASTEKTDAVTRVFRSSDRGASWKRLPDVHGCYWAGIFVHRGALYLMGTQRQYGGVVILRSADGGETWTRPVDSRSGLLLSDGRYHTAPVPVVVHGGRIWRAMEDAMGPGGWGTHFRAFVLSAPLEASLLDASSWTATNRLERDPSWLDGQFGGWLEGNVVPAPGGGIVNVLRVDSPRSGEKAAVVEVGADGKSAVFKDSEGFVEFPGGAKKFTIRRDPITGLYWSLANHVPEPRPSALPAKTRNTLALTCSSDLKTWTVRAIILQHPDVEKHGFQYADWLFEGDDLIAAVRTAFDDGLGGAHNQHDANFLTFHRISGFRKLERR